MRKAYINIDIKALLILGSALVFVCCGGSEGESSAAQGRSQERLMTEFSENLKIVMSENGRPSYIFEAPLVKGYTLAQEPYREFDDGIVITTFTDDSLSMRDAEMRSNYALYYENRKLWETRGDVEVVKSDGKELYTQQLFWNAQTKRIYSNVETKIMDRSTGDVYEGEGFESDESMEEWSFRKLTGRMKMEVAPRAAAEQPEQPTKTTETLETEVSDAILK